MKWYDLFSNIYDSSLEKLYYESRKSAVELLDLKTGHTVIDIACGTGSNFKHIKANNPEIDLYGTDFSDGMLKKAQINIDKNKWEKITLFHSDAQLLSKDHILKQTGENLSIDRVLCVLGLSVIPEWTLALENMLGLLKEEGKIVIVDVYAEKRNINTWLIEKIAQADVSRKIWQTLREKTINFHYEYLPVKESKVGGKLFAAVGTKNK
jgi:S-adenosylmethionine-diacylgycerolhomoserine-N-methlytransferase